MNSIVKFTPWSFPGPMDVYQSKKLPGTTNVKTHSPMSALNTPHLIDYSLAKQQCQKLELVCALGRDSAEQSAELRN